MKPFWCMMRLRIILLYLPIPDCVSLIIMVTIISHIFINIFQIFPFSAVKFSRANEKNMTFLLIPKSQKVWKNSEAIGPGSFNITNSYTLFNGKMYIFKYEFLTKRSLTEKFIKCTKLKIHITIAKLSVQISYSCSGLLFCRSVLHWPMWRKTMWKHCFKLSNISYIIFVIIVKFLGSPPKPCIFRGQIYDHGDAITLPYDECTSCVCDDGELSCKQIVCEPPNCVNPVKVPGQCCRICSKLGCLFLWFITNMLLPI